MKRSTKNQFKNKYKLASVNAAFDAPTGKWMVELRNSNKNNGQPWILRQGLSEESACERAQEFGEFSGLPVTKNNKPMGKLVPSIA